MRLLRPALLGLALLVLTGCGQEDIAHYKVPRIENADPTVRMLGAIIPTDNATWFIKYTGPTAKVAPHEDSYLKLLASVKFPDEKGEEITYDLPEGWTAKAGGSEFRHATLTLPENGGITTVTKFGKDAGSVLANINRWRKEVGLGDLKEEELPEAVKKVPLAKGEATLLAVTGPGARKENRPGPAGPKGPFDYELPEGWKVGGKTDFSLLTIAAGDAKLTVSPVGGSLKENMARWLNQTGLPADADAVTKSLKARNLGGLDGYTVEMIGKEEAFLGAAVPFGKQHLYFKLSGPPKAVEPQKAAFEKFLQSLQFEAGKGANDGK